MSFIVCCHTLEHNSQQKYYNSHQNQNTLFLNFIFQIVVSLYRILEALLSHVLLFYFRIERVYEFIEEIDRVGKKEEK